MIIDIHQHARGFPPYTAPGLLANMDQNGIDLSWLLTWEIPPFEHREKHHPSMNPAAVRPDGTHPGVTLSDCLGCCEAYPDRFVLGYCTHPLIEGATHRLQAVHDFYNARICGEWKFRILLDDPRCVEVFRLAGRLSMPVLVHMRPPYRPDEQGQMTYDPMWYGGGPGNFERAMQACPDTVFIGHAPGFWREISGDADASPSGRPTTKVVPGGRLIRWLQEYPQLYCDLSATSALRALDRDPAHARDFLTGFADRVLFGRDCIDSTLHDFLQTLNLPEDVMSKIYCENARRLVPLDT